MYFDAMGALKIMFLLQFYIVFCSSFGALKSHDLSSATSVHVRVIVDSMRLGEGGRILSRIPRFEINQSISTFTDWHGADLLCNLDNNKNNSPGRRPLAC